MREIMNSMWSLILKLLSSHKKYVIIIAAAFMFPIVVAICSPIKADAVSKKPAKTAVSVLIEEGDSLWSIASEFYTEECGSINEYIEEIKKTNNMKTDAIFTGCHIIIPYYKK